MNHRSAVYFGLLIAAVGCSAVGTISEKDSNDDTKGPVPTGFAPSSPDPGPRPTPTVEPPGARWAEPTASPQPLSLFEPGTAFGGGLQFERDCVAPGTMVTPGVLSQSFSTTCAGCHGSSGEGRGGIPSIPGALSLEQFLAVARTGKNEKMPAFAESKISDTELVSDYATLTARTIAAPASLTCSTAETWTAQRYRNAVTRGLAAWRTPDAHEAAACANCHGMAPFDLAYIGYDDATIIRRALMHLEQQDAFDIVELVRAIRMKHGLPAVRNFHDFRPFQPGNVVLGAQPGEDLSTQFDRAPQADHVFGEALAAALPTIAGPPITTVESARQARDEYLSINPRTFPIAIAFNRWTEDKHHGDSHATLNDWVPDRPHVPADLAARQELEAAHDAYLANPSWETMKAVEESTQRLTGIVNTTPESEELFRRKYASVLIAQHQFLLEANGDAGYRSMDAVTFPFQKPVWEVGNFARVNSKGVPLPTSVLENISPATTLTDEMSRLRMSWLFAGWLFDRTLYHIDGTNSTKSSEYFTGHLYQYGYYNHLTYIRFRKNLAVAYDPGGAASDDGVQRVAHGATQNRGYFLGYGRGMGDHTPEDPTARELYLRLLANSMRMMLLLIADEVEQTGTAHGLENLREMPHGSFRTFLTQYGVPEDIVTLDRLAAALAVAREM